MSFPFDIRIPLRLSNGLNAREHHHARARRVRCERSSVQLSPAAALRHWAGRGDTFHVTLTRWWGARQRALDTDNLQGSLKAVRDEVAVLLGVDDKDPRVAWDCQQDRDPRGIPHVGIRVERRDPNRCPTCGAFGLPVAPPGLTRAQRDLVLSCVEPPLETPDGTVQRDAARGYETSSFPEAKPEPRRATPRAASGNRSAPSSHKAPARDLAALATSAYRGPKKGGVR